MNYKVGIRLYMEFEHNRRLLEGILHYIHSGAQWQITANPFFSHHWPQILKECDGAIVQIYEKPLAKIVNALRIPVVSTVNSAFTPNLPAVINDDGAVGKMAAEYLLGLNCHAFGFAGFYYPRAWSQERGAAFVERLTKAGYKCNLLAPFENYRGPSFKYSWTPANLKSWLKSLPPRTGIFAATDFIGIMVIDACRELGLAMPEDMGVIGVDDNVMLCEMASTPLTSIATDARRLGFEAAQILDLMMKGKKPRQHQIKLPPLDIVVRRSTEFFAIDDPILAKAMQFIAANCRNRISVPDVLKNTPLLCRRNLERRFREKLSCSIHETIIRARINRAKRSLAETNRTMATVAEQAGFSDAKKLDEYFRKATGLTPTAYRKRCSLP
ncbi:MAG: substrate-binding domain-containing protein [Verrucomicrobia bacterium]|nr:substrate-binding domain-containing protein [Verrucomicrobiota bacterium]MBU1735298.1 substrate-binding domain-containing protein [Verrucomicrobiota bacterium]MBU1855471.1 substrate-binding domain-containing protein [Verrucomicrobiota bacterium]